MTTTTAAMPHLADGKDWGRALGGLRRLLGDPDDTTAVFEIMRALNGDSIRAGLARLTATPVGAALAERRDELAPRLMDDRWLDGFAPGTLGAAYRAFVRSERLSADGLAEVSRTGLAPELVDQPTALAWYGRRIRDVHDLWHVLTGYGRDPLGEACLVAFSFSQTRGPGWAVIALGALAKGGGRQVRGVRRAILQGFSRGRRSAWLPAADYPALMAMPLEQARAALGITPPTRYQAVVAAVAGQA